MRGLLVCIILASAGALPGIVTRNELLQDVNALVLSAEIHSGFSKGEEVVIEGLQKKPEYNNRRCHLLSLPDEAGIVHVDLDGQEASISVSNLRALSLQDALRPGASVIVKNLKDHPNFNGKRGLITLGPSGTDDLVQVVIDETTYAVHMANLELASEDHIHQPPNLSQTATVAVTNVAPNIESATNWDNDNQRQETKVSTTDSTNTEIQTNPFALGAAVRVVNLTKKQSLNGREGKVLSEPDVAGTARVLIDDKEVMIHVSHLEKAIEKTPESEASNTLQTPLEKNDAVSVTSETTQTEATTDQSVKAEVSSQEVPQQIPETKGEVQQSEVTKEASSSETAATDASATDGSPQPIIAVATPEELPATAPEQPVASPVEASLPDFKAATVQPELAPSESTTANPVDSSATEKSSESVISEQSTQANSVNADSQISPSDSSSPLVQESPADSSSLSVSDSARTESHQNVSPEIDVLNTPLETLSREQLQLALKNMLTTPPKHPSVTIPVSQSVKLISIPSDVIHFLEGDSVVLEGLQDDKFNGLVGTVRAEAGQDGRVLVELASDGSRVQVMPGKLERYHGSVVPKYRAKKALSPIVVD